MYRRYRPLTMWRELDRLHRQMDRLFDGYTRQRAPMAPGFPAVNVWADEESVLISAELPGMDSDDIEINVVDDTLTLSGERSEEQIPEEARVHRQERGYGQFSRSINMPYRIDIDNVDANFKNGVLQITLPRAEEDRPKKISVSAN